MKKKFIHLLLFGTLFYQKNCSLPALSDTLYKKNSHKYRLLFGTLFYKKFFSREYKKRFSCKYKKNFLTNIKKFLANIKNFLTNISCALGHSFIKRI